MLKQPVTWLLFLLGGLGAITAKTILTRQDNLFEQSRDFPEILHLVDIAYVDEVDMEKLMPGVFQGALEKLDENASYIPPGVIPVFLGKKIYAGTGMVMAKKHGLAYVVAVAEGSPAAEAGIKADTYIRRIGKESTRELSLFRILGLLAARKSTLELTLVESGGTDDVIKKIRPGSFPKVEMSHTPYANGLHLIQIPQFYEGLRKDLKKVLKRIESPEARIVLDLRNNAMGAEEELSLLAAYFLPAGRLATWVDAGNRTLDILNPKDGSHLGRALFILQDRSTSQAAESFIAISQEQGLAQIVGIHSLGLLGHYQAIPLKSGGHVMLSTRRLRLNSGKMPGRSGLKPDLEVKVPKETTGVDPFLEKALELVRTSQLKKTG